MRFCLIDSDASFRKKLRYHLEVEWPDADIVEFEFATAAVPSPGTLSDCDATLVGCPQHGHEGFAGLERLFDRSFFPPAVLFAARGDEFLAVDALKAGAASYFPKDHVQHRRLIDTLREVLGAERGAAGPALVGTHGQYRFVRELHSTDIATVYLAERIDNGDEQLAIKLIRYVPDTGGERLFDRFLQEYEIIARIDHPNVVRISDLGVADDHAFIAMEYLASGRLSDRLGTALPPPIAIEYLAQIASALDAVHGMGILHRDLKPANIMFRADDSIALIDFGLAKWMQLEAALTGKGQIFGTPYYMSPEQGHAETTDERADLYSLGCIFYEMLTGKRPFTSSSAMGIIYRHANSLRPDLDPSLLAYQPLLDRLMAVAPADRFQSAAKLLDAIEALTDPAARSVSR
ncbi:MAG TPA: protein kinase [Gammaproteobacteria bacterium]|nr:protein kinase [Gammaproteobacteria bacterium]